MKGVDYEYERREMVERLRRQGIVKSREVAKALLTVPREEFVWPGMEHLAYLDTPLPLGSTGQTISAPHMVSIMLEEFELKPGLKVLEIGAGSGYNAALMAEIVRPSSSDVEGNVISVERVPELIKFANENLERTGYSSRVTVVMGDGTLGCPERSEEMLYDRIIVTAAAPHIPKYLKAQLKVEGILLIPMGDVFMQSLVKAVKLKDGSMRSSEVCGCMFVSLVGEDGFRI